MMAQDLTPLELTDADLDELSTLTDQDLLAAHLFMVKELDPKFKNLPLAEDQELIEAEDDAEPA